MGFEILADWRTYEFFFHDNKNKHFVLVSVKLRQFPTSSDNLRAVSGLQLIHKQEYFWKCWLLLFKKNKRKSPLIFSLLSLLKHNFQKKHFELSGRRKITHCCERKSAVLSMKQLLEIIVLSEGVWVPLCHKKFKQCSSVNQNPE